jgi:hypothetical protein
MSLKKLSRGSRHSKSPELASFRSWILIRDNPCYSSHRYPTISEYELDRAHELRKSPEVLSALKLQLKAVSLGEKPWAEGVLIAIMEKLNPSEPLA